LKIESNRKFSFKGNQVFLNVVETDQKMSDEDKVADKQEAFKKKVA
jgi:hypothetical protein